MLACYFLVPVTPLSTWSCDGASFNHIIFIYNFTLIYSFYFIIIYMFLIVDLKRLVTKFDSHYSAL